MSAKTDVSPDQLNRVAALVGKAATTTGIPEALRTLTEGLVGITGADGAQILLEQDGHLVACYADEGGDPFLGREVPIEGSVDGACYTAGGPVLSDDLSRDRRFAELDRSGDELSLIALPLHLDGPPVGVVRLTASDTARFGGRELTATRLVVAAIRKVLLMGVRKEREALGIRERDFASSGVWALRDRRKAQLDRVAGGDGMVSLVRYDIRGYLTADIIHHIAAVVRTSDHVFQDDAGTFTLILTGTGAADAEIVARRVKGEIEKMAELGGDPVEVNWEVTELQQETPVQRIA